MKVHTIALSTIVLLAGTSTHAFAPRKTVVQKLSTSTISTSTITNATANTITKNTALFTAATISDTTAAKVGVDLGLIYTPVAPFGKCAPDPKLGTDAKKALGGKGANLAEMSELGLSVPPGFTITTECCDRYCNDDSWNKGLPKPLWEEIVHSIDAVQDEMQSEFGSPQNPLLLSVRSGAAISMPGMVRTTATRCNATRHSFCVNIDLRTNE